MAVTGASEFLGQSLVEYLQRGTWASHICVIDVRDPPCATGPRTSSHPIDLTQPEAGLEVVKVFRQCGVDILVHLAFISHPIHDVDYAHELQVIGTMHLLNAAAAVRLKKIVILGDTKVYGARADNPALLAENSPLRGASESPLVADLVEVEKQLARFASRHRSITCTTLRMANILSRSVDGFIPRLLSKPVVPTVMGFDPPMQFLHHADAFRAIVTAVLKDHPGVFNIVPDGTVSLSAAIAAGGRLALPLPLCAWRTGGSFLWSLQAIDMPPELVDYLRFPFLADGDTARRKMGFEPEFSSLDTVFAFYGRKRQPGTAAAGKTNGGES